MLNKVVKVKSLDKHLLEVEFADGAHGVFDATGILDGPGPLVEQLWDEAYFKRAFIEAGAVTWPNGYDLCPDWLRQQMSSANALLAPQAAE